MNLKNLWGMTRGWRFAAACLAITALFVIFEARYNIDLLNTLSSPDASSEEIDLLSQRGKVIASLGIAWVLGRFLISRIQPPLLGLSLFAACCAVVYTGLDHLYTTVIAGLAPEVKVEGFNLFSYRHDLLTGKLFDPDIPLPKDHPVEGKILMGSFPIVLLDDRFMLPAQDIVERKAGDKSTQVMRSAAEQWPAYLRRMGELSSAHQEFVDGSRQAHQHSAFGGIRKFQQRSGGLKPNPNLTRIQFVEMLRNSQHPRGQQIRDAEARAIGTRPDGSMLYARELPYFMDRQAYMNWFENQANQAKAAALPNAQNVESFQGIQDINSAVFLPPMAIITSLTSALTNAVTLAFMLLGAALSVVPGWGKAALWIKRLTAPLMLATVAGVVLLMPSHVFRPNTPLYELETTMHREIGLAGHAWSRLSGIQAKMLK